MHGAWYPDPSGRYELRWYDGEQWTHYVSRGGWAGTDTPPPPLPGAAPALALPSPVSGTNGLAIAGFVIALAGALGGIAPSLFFQALAGGVLGIIFSLAGLDRARQMPHHRGTRLAATGIVLSVAALALGVRGAVEIFSRAR